MNSTRWATWLTSEKTLPWLGAIIAALIACWVNYQAHGVINNDGVLYLEVARLFDSGLWREGVATYNWPFYSLLIMLTHKVSGLSLQISANALTVIFFSLTALGIATLIREAGGDKKTIMAGFALLFCAPYLVGEILPMVAREHGYWAAQVWSVVFFMRFLSAGLLKNAFLWGAAALTSVLFRIEGLTYFVLLPVMILWLPATPAATRVTLFLKANIVALVLGTMVAAVLLLHPTLELKDMGRLGDPVMIIQAVYDQLAFGLANRSEIISQALGSYLDDYAMPTLLLGMAYILALKSLTVGGLVQSILALGFWKKTKQLMPVTHYKLFAWLLALSLLNAAIILTKGFILPKRILSPIAFVIIIFAAYGITLLIEKMRSDSRLGSWRWIMVATVIALSLQALIALRPSTPKHRFERTAVEWLLEQAPPDSRIYFATHRMRFYASKPPYDEPDWQLRAHQMQQTKDQTSAFDGLTFDYYDYLLFTVSRRDAAQENLLGSHFGNPLATFGGPRGKRVLIYSRPHNN